MTRLAPALSFALLLALAALAALPALAEDEPPYDVEQEELKSEAPPFKLERPSDSWLFIKLDLLKEQLRKKGEDTSGMQTLKGRLWWGAAKADIYLNVWPSPDGSEDVEAVGKARLEALQKNLLEPQVKSAKLKPVGKRAAYVFELEGKPPRQGAQPITIVQAVVLRPEDKQVFVITLEVAANGRVEDAKKDFQKLLRSKLKV